MKYSFFKIFRSLSFLSNIFLILFILVFVVLYFFLAEVHISQINQNRLASDQDHNISQAQKCKLIRNDADGLNITEKLYKNFPHFTDGIVNPLMPWIASFFVIDDREESFIYGKIFNVLLSVCFCVLLTFVCYKIFSFTFFACINICLLSGFAVFLKRSTFFQPEPIFYILFFLSWLCCMSLLGDNRLWLYFILGILASLAYLAKASITPMLLLFFGICFFRIMVVFFKDLFCKKNFHNVRSLDYVYNWSVGNFIIGCFIFSIIYFMMILPTLFYKGDKYGDMWLSYPSYWMWMDNFEPEAYSWLGKYNTKEALASLTKENKPSLSLYRKTHSDQELFDRLRDGSSYVLGKFFYPRYNKSFKSKKSIRDNGRDSRWIMVLPDRGKYVLFLLCMLFVLILFVFFHNLYLKIVNNKKVDVGGKVKIDKSGISLRLLSSDCFYRLLFLLGSFCGYILLFGWYVPIGRGERFMLMLYLPIVFTLIYSCESIFQQMWEKKVFFRYSYKVYVLFHMGLTAHICLRLYDVINYPLFMD